MWPLAFFLFISLPERVVSLAPSLTETVFALGAGNRLVGVTDFCDYPPQAKRIQKVGGWVDPNMEMILSLRPDMVLLVEYQKKVAEKIDRLGIRTLVVETTSVEAILRSFEQVGDALGLSLEGKRLREKVEREMAKVRQRDKEKKRVLLVVGRREGSISELYVATKKSFLGDLLDMAGGRNVAGDLPGFYALLSREAILSMQPEVVIEIAGDTAKGEKEVVREALSLWSEVKGLKAVETGNVFVVADRSVNRPGPRMGETLLLFSRFLEGLGAHVP